jgi:DNA-binding MarR family transcriptional regulator
MMEVFVSESKVTQQAHYIFKIAKMLRHHVFSSLARVEGQSRECTHGDLSLAQLNLIIAVRGRGEVTLSELAEILVVSPPSVSVMVERLVEKGLLVRERATRDRRKVVIHVSPDANQHIAAMEERMIATFVELVEEVGPETADKWYEVLRQVELVLQSRQTGSGTESR